MATIPPAGIEFGKWIIIDPDDEMTHPTFSTEIAAEEYAAVQCSPGALIVPVATNITIVEVAD